MSTDPAETAPKTVAYVAVSVGQLVNVISYRGKVVFVGETQFAPGIWVGVVLEEPVGKNDGSVQGVRYFKAKPLHGMFVRQGVAKPIGRPKNADGESESDFDGEFRFADYEAISRARGCRAGVSSEIIDLDSSWKTITTSKSEEERKRLLEILMNSRDGKHRMIFRSVSTVTLMKIIECMYLKKVAAGERVMVEGEAGDTFYVVKQGHFDLMARKKAGAASVAGGAAGGRNIASGVAGGASPLVKVADAGVGYSFGELALLHAYPRSVTAVATEYSEVWCLDREVFRNLVVRASDAKFQEIIEFLYRCEIFSELTIIEIERLAEIMQEQSFDVDETIIEQGGKDDMMYLVRSGEAVACVKKGENDKEVEVRKYREGECFGEAALLSFEPRKASVYATKPTRCASISNEAFTSVIGPLDEVLSRNINKYPRYHKMIEERARQRASRASPPHDASREGMACEMYTAEGFSSSSVNGGKTRNAASRDAHSEHVEEEIEEETEVYDGGATIVRKKIITRKRVRVIQRETNIEEEEHLTRTHVRSEETRTLRDRFAADYEVSELVEPDPSLIVKEADLQVYGGLRLDEEFMEDKRVICQTSFTPTREGPEERYFWRAPITPFQKSTQVAVLCQRGQKSPQDPTPNQDSFFVLSIGAVQVYGVVDGHGPAGHLVTFRIVQSLQHALVNSTHFGNDWEKCTMEAFASAQDELLDFCDEHDVDLDASGAAASVLIFDGPRIHVAWIGDCGVMVASYNRRDPRLVLCTEDHKPQLPKERQRLEEAGTEVREVDGKSYRIYVKGSDFPGLTMSRAFGDTACEGILQEPSYRQIVCDANDEFYAIVASDGIWEFIDHDQAVELTAKKLRQRGANDTLRFLVDCSRKRWSYCCGEYCDDITAILIQWNMVDKNAPPDTNHSLYFRHS